MKRRSLSRLLGLILGGACCGTSGAWDASGHRDITLAALRALPENSVPFAKSEDIRLRIADQATVPDRWRSARVAQLQHASNPDHYFDLEDLEPYEITFEQMPNLRVEFIKKLMEIRAAKGWKLPPKPVNPARDTDKTQEWPGFLPWAICEQYGKVLSAFRVIRTLETVNDPARAYQLEQARADAMVQMGLLSHFIGDAAQPLHTTKHHHGWIGENPDGYTTDRGIHSYIDGTIVTFHKIDADAILQAAKSVPARKIDGLAPWNDALAHIRRSFEQVVPLYQLKKSGKLEEAQGKEFIESRMADGAATLSAMYAAAWEAAAPDKKDIEDFKKYDGQAAK